MCSSDLSHVSARNVKNGGVVLESKNPSGTLSDYLISDNLAEITDHIHGVNGVITGNIPFVQDGNTNSKNLADKGTKSLPSP